MKKQKIEKEEIKEVVDIIPAEEKAPEQTKFALLLKKKKIKLKDIEGKTKISHQTLSELKTGKRNPRWSTILTLSSFLKVKPTDII